MGRAAQGVRLLSIDKPDFVIGLDRIVKESEAEASAEESIENTEKNTQQSEETTKNNLQEQLPFDDKL